MIDDFEGSGSEIPDHTIAGDSHLGARNRRRPRSSCSPSARTTDPGSPLDLLAAMDIEGRGNLDLLVHLTSSLFRIEPRLSTQEMRELIALMDAQCEEFMPGDSSSPSTPLPSTENAAAEILEAILIDRFNLRDGSLGSDLIRDIGRAKELVRRKFPGLNRP